MLIFIASKSFYVYNIPAFVLGMTFNVIKEDSL